MRDLRSAHATCAAPVLPTYFHKLNFRTTRPDGRAECRDCGAWVDNLTWVSEDCTVRRELGRLDAAPGEGRADG